MKFKSLRKKLRYNFTWNSRKFYIPAFNPLWWIITIVLTGAAGWLVYEALLAVLMLGVLLGRMCGLL